MKVEHLKEAQQIVDSIASIDQRLSYKLASSYSQLNVENGRNVEYLAISREVAEKALALQKEVMRKRRAELVRRANQIGLVIGGGDG